MNPECTLNVHCWAVSADLAFWVDGEQILQSQWTNTDCTQKSHFTPQSLAPPWIKQHQYNGGEGEVKEFVQLQAARLHRQGHRGLRPEDEDGVRHRRCRHWREDSKAVRGGFCCRVKVETVLAFSQAKTADQWYCHNFVSSGRSSLCDDVPLYTSISNPLFRFSLISHCQMKNVKCQMENVKCQMKNVKYKMSFVKC